MFLLLHAVLIRAIGVLLLLQLLLLLRLQLLLLLRLQLLLLLRLLQAATDNAVAALGDLVEHQQGALGSDLGSLTQTWLELLPLKQDATEGIRVHRQLLEALQRVGTLPGAPWAISV